MEPESPHDVIGRKRFSPLALVLRCALALCVGATAARRLVCRGSVAVGSEETRKPRRPACLAGGRSSRHVGSAHGKQSFGLKFVGGGCELFGSDFGQGWPLTTTDSWQTDVDVGDCGLLVG